MLTNQELFDAALTALRAQGVASIDPIQGKCVYRGPGGLKCAIGHVIPDEAYMPGMEGKVASAMAYRFNLNLFREDGVDLANRLQRAHDYYMPLADDTVEPFSQSHRWDVRVGLYRGMEVWEAEMRSIALEFNLNYTEPAA